ncbi:MAG: tetratricopeptide repeat protein [Methylacidiphilales bacterium]|nr:tetratricopeptide repeat protein [Candidatus Methylacidiphilales bacterium]
MKWFLIGSVCLFCSATWVWGDPAADLYNQGITALQDKKYDEATKAFDAIITGYPTTANIDDVRISDGYAYLNAGKFNEAVDRLSKLAGDLSKPNYRATALYFVSLAQFSEGQKNHSNSTFKLAAETLTTLINLITTAPTPDNKAFLEQSIYYRALAQYLRDDYNDSEKDLLQLTQSAQFSDSLMRPDYFLRLGSIYAVETNQQVTSLNDARKKALDARKSPEAIAALESSARDKISALASKALSAFDAVSRDPNALVQANEANMSKAQIYFLLAQFDATPAGYEKALEAYRLVKRKDDLIPQQQKRLDELRTQAQNEARALTEVKTLSSNTSLVIGREENRLEDLQNGPDPIIQALIGIAECYVSMDEPDEARTILNRLVAHAALTPDQQQEVDFQILYSYVLGGQTDKADAALTAYLGKHGNDPQADSISYQIAAKLMDRKDYAGALHQAQRSLHDFPKGTYALYAVGLEAQALTRLQRYAEAGKVVDDYVKANPNNPKVITLVLDRAQNETGAGNLAAALADYQTVRTSPAADPDLQAVAATGYIQTLRAMGRFDDVISEARAFQAKYPNSNALPNVLLFAALAMDQKHDPGAVAALQDLAKKFPKAEVSPFALSFVVNIYHRANNVPAMIQAANDLRQAYPEAYTYLAQADDEVSTVLEAQKKFDDAVALYQPLAQAPKPDVAAAARNKIGDVWLAAAKSLGYYQSMPLATRAEAEKRLSAAVQAYLGTLTTFPDQLNAVGDAFEGLTSVARQRRSWDLLKDADLEGYLGKFETNFTAPDMQARFDLAKAGLVFVYKNGATQYPAALDQFKKVIAANPGLRLTRQETDQYGELLLAEQDYPAALKVYGDLLDNAAANDPLTNGYAYYGLGAANLGQGNLAQAKVYFLKLKALPNGGVWHPHILDANYGIALADEQSGQPADLDEARQIYAGLMQTPQSGVVLQAKSMIGYGRLLEKSGHGLSPTSAGPTENAVHYYQEPHLLFGPASPEQSAEGLFDAGQVYEKAGDKTNAKKQYDDLLQNYATTAPDWAARAHAAETDLADGK